jgi:hypothetical protein
MGHPFQTLEADAAPFKASPTHRTNPWQTRLSKPVVAAKLRDGFAAHVALQHGRLGFAQVDQHQSVQYVREFAVDIEAQEFAADFSVLPQENGKSLAVELDIGNRLGEFVEITQGFAGCPAVPFAEPSGTKWAARRYQSGEFVLSLPLFEEGKDEFAGGAAVRVADADCAK